MWCRSATSLSSSIGANNVQLISVDKISRTLPRGDKSQSVEKVYDKLETRVEMSQQDDTSSNILHITPHSLH